MTFGQTGAQCFHWAEPDYQSAISEFARVLKPGGTLALIWNLEDRKKARWVAQIRDAYESYEEGTPQYRLGWWRKMFDTEAYKVSIARGRRIRNQIERLTLQEQSRNHPSKNYCK